jgi:hypothetical protein
MTEVSIATGTSTAGTDTTGTTTIVIASTTIEGTGRGGMKHSYHPPAPTLRTDVAPPLAYRHQQRYTSQPLSRSPP